MDFHMVFGIMIVASGITSTSTTTCEIRNYISSCSYDVRCVTNSGSVSNPNCDNEPNVTFIIVDSNQSYLSAGFFAATNFDSRVRHIKVIASSWTTIDTTAFRYYSKCIHIDLSYTKVENINTDTFRGLTNMKYLNLSHNNIESFTPRSFFISELKHTTLRWLDLSYNKLKYIGNELQNVPNLENLYLQNNQLSALSDDVFLNFKSLSALYLQNNLLTSINLTLIHLSRLRYLDLSYNNLSKLAGYQINRLEAIVNFNVSHNKLISIDSNCFELAVNLSQADFSFNEIKITIKSDMFINNKQLHYLNFYNNKVEGIQENVFQNNDISYLNLERNNISGDIKENTFSNLRNLSYFDLSQQNFTGIRNNAFGDMKNLQTLNLSRNCIMSVDTLAFANTSITLLDLSYNKISNLLFLKKYLLNLTEFYINNNNLIALPKNIFSDQMQLKTVDLSKNNIISIEEYSLPLNMLQYLDIVDNKINGAIKPNMFSPAKYLRFLDLSHFNITKVDNLAFNGLPVMAKLNLSNNYIDVIEEDSFKETDNLFNLDISYNNLTFFKFNSSKLPNLRALYLQNNKLANISNIFLNQSKLSYLDLSSNNIVNVSGLDSNVLPNITALYLNNNKIKDFNNAKTNSLVTLIDLGLSSNQISEITLCFFKELMSIDLSNNNLALINKTMLQDNEYLQLLDLSRNKIRDLPPGTFLFMKNLKFVNLSSNFLTKLRYGSLKGLHKTEILDLSRNMITVLDVDVFHECEELKTLIIDYNRIKTFDVERLIIFSAKKLRTLSLGGNPILCREIVHNIKSVNVSFYAVRQVEVTSVDKVYHEDNVHGIKCGDEQAHVTENPAKIDTMSGHLSNEKEEASSSTVITLIWCSVITIFLIFGGLFLYKYRYAFVMRNNRTHNLSDSIYQSDLLS